MTLFYIVYCIYCIVPFFLSVVVIYTTVCACFFSYTFVNCLFISFFSLFSNILCFMYFPYIVIVIVFLFVCVIKMSISRRPCTVLAGCWRECGEVWTSGVRVPQIIRTAQISMWSYCFHQGYEAARWSGFGLGRRPTEPDKQHSTSRTGNVSRRQLRQLVAGRDRCCCSVLS